MTKYIQLDEKHIKDLTAAEEVIRGLTFEVFKEEVSCQVLQGIDLTDYDTVINRFAEKFNIPHDVRVSLLDARYGEEDNEILMDFKYETGKTGTFTYGRIAVLRNHYGIYDVAYSMYLLEFELSPQGNKQAKIEKLLSFVSGNNVWKKKQRILSQLETHQMHVYFLNKAITHFKSEYRIFFP